MNIICLLQRVYLRMVNPNGNIENREVRSNMSDHEMLQELLEFKRRYEQRRKIEIIIHVVLVLILATALILAWVKISATMKQVQEKMAVVTEATEKVNEVSRNLEDFLGSLKEAGIDKPAEVIKNLLENTQKLNDFVARFEKSGMKGLEQGAELAEGAKGFLSGLFG